MPIRPTLLGVPFDAASSFQRGPAEAPPAIRAALATESSNAAAEDGRDIGAPGVLGDAGDLALSTDAATARQQIEAGVATVLDGATPLVLGGDHSITYPVLRAIAARYPGLTVVHFDAHSDLYDHFEGDRYSHACPFARAMEERLAGRLIQVGLRTLTAHQRDQAARFGVEQFEMRHWDGPFVLTIDGPVYVSLDIDVLDPAFAPGISHPEPGGLSVRDVVSMIQRLRGRLIGADLVEFNPRNDPSPRTGLVCAKFVKEIVAAMHRNA